MEIDQVKIEDIKNEEIKLEGPCGTKEDSIYPSIFINLISQSNMNTTTQSKSFLKITRKLCRLILHNLDPPIDSQVAKHIIETADLINTFIDLFSKSRFQSVMIQEVICKCLCKIWSDVRDYVSYTKNKKICLISKEIWSWLFEMKSYSNLLEMEFNLHDSENRMIASLLLHLNVLLVCKSIVDERFQKSCIKSKISDAQLMNFMILMFTPRLYKFYNHKVGKFALECCDKKCKISASADLPPTFLIQLEYARRLCSWILYFVYRNLESPRLLFEYIVNVCIWH